MAQSLNLQVVTPQRSLLNIEAESVMVHATEGYLGILPMHAPIITGLQAGILKYRQGGNNLYLSVGGGFMEVSQNRVTILADTAEKPEEINRERAEAAKSRAETRLRERTPDIDLVRAELALKKALVRLKVSQYLK